MELRWQQGVFLPTATDLHGCTMAGPYTRRDDDDHDHDELELDAVYALHHLDSQQHDDDNELDTQTDDERAPFYSHLNSSYGHARGNGSEASLPLYRSRSQSLSAAAANNEQHHNNSSNKLPAMPGQPPAASTPAPNVRAVDYSQTDSADNLRRAQPPSSRQSSSRANTLQSSTTTSSNSNHNDTSQSTTWSSNANTLTNSQTPSSQTPVPQHHDKKRIDWAAEVARVFDPATGTTKSFADEKIEHANHNGGNNQGSAISRTSSPLAPGMARRWTETDLDDENGFDDYDWEDDDELVRQLDKKYEDEYKKANDPEDKRRRRTVIRRFSPVHLLNLLLFTFLGNLVFIFLLIAPALIVQFLVKGKTQDEHLQFVCDNIEAWCYWIAFNFIAKWIIHSLFDLIPKLFVFVVELIWGDLNERFIGYVELFNASAPYIKPLFFAGFFWGSFAITFNSIFDLRNASDPENSRAPYTYRIYQVVECLFFIALIWSIEKILIRYISLNFHAVAYADRLKNNTFALTTIDKLKSYRPKRSKRNGAGHSGFNTPSAFRVGFGGVSTAGDGYFSSTMGRSRGNTPPFSSPRQMASPDAPGTPEPSHQSLWSRLPIPSTFRGSSYNSHRQNIPSIDNAIPLQVTAQHFTGENRRNIAGHPTSGTSNSQQGEHQHNLSSSQPESASTSIPTTPANNISTDAQNRQIQQGKKNKKQKAKHLFGKKAATAQEIARQAMVDPLKTLNNPDIVGKGLGLEFGGAKDAKKLARDLFYAFRSDSTRNYLITSDFYPAFKTESEAEAAFAVFDKDGNGDISRPEIRATILAAYKERKFLARSLQDVSEAVSTLDKLFQVGALIILALIALAIFQVNIYSNLTTAYTIAIAASFIFKSAAQNVFDSVIFLFATHPFDSGDRIFLETEVYVVKQLGLFSTLFTKWDGTETMIANSKLGTLTITNLRRSPPQFENATLQVGWNTSLDQLDELEKKMNNWLQKDEKRMFAPSTAVVLQKFVYMQYIEITIGMLHRENWQDWGERWNRRTAFHAALLHYCKEIGITFVNSLQPVQYYQDDLDQPPVEDDNDDLDDMRSPLSPSDGENQIPAPASHQQPLMGFLPPEGSTMRRRKGYSKSKNMAGVGA